MKVMEKVANALQILGGVILSIGYIPQIIQIMQTHLVRDINYSFNIMIMIGVLFMEVYAIYLVKSKKSGHAFLVTNTMSTICAIMMVVLVSMYK
jgi:MtN3 and saliva related transmembrane protein